MDKSKKLLNFDTDDFSDKDFLDFIKEPIQEKIQYFSVLMSKKNKEEEPLIFWLNTGRKAWYRFFIDAWVVHWNEYNEVEKEELMEEDSEEHTDYFVRDLAKEFNLTDEKINEIEVRRFYENELFVSQIKISIVNDLTIVIRDYDDKKPSELLLRNGI